MPDFSLTVEALLTGTPGPIYPGVLSAMAKSPVSGPVRITWLGLEGDKVADPMHHGGHDKAIHLYPLDYYSWWRTEIGEHPLLEAPGAFGENIGIKGATDADFCLGDKFSMGDAVLEVSHGRQPCSKLNARFGRRDILSTVVETGRSGFYFRVLKEGLAQAGDQLTLTERSLPEWPMTRVFDLLIAGGHVEDPEGVATLARLPVLAGAWQSRAIQLAR